ncbi:MAG: hypothetical protein JSW02_03025 [candidate division WOR-3 bacterium]|nr:MAG: hypothetical protein JSW02_03025 [candidate division WOR-3 bacterium]
MAQRSRGMAVITLAISMVLAAILVVIALALFTRSTPTEEGGIAAPIEKGKSVQCLAQRRRVEASVQMYWAEHGSFPASLDDLADMFDEEFLCPVTGASYIYHRATGKLTCPDHP